ncbi:hypothetical protein [Streptomyces coeruleorubidus]|uniref:Uncharacterized protein n=1 Tax=Streptomyces coeruleorubidus TaxID=116188 RepID=A0ABZ0K6L3_STRC4|nr:hypothetical protein [Streptomyces coeruleorubidus]WOT33582.1 hypothetical protein R5U08_05185 [Streptomyces coeruleorubidus]
MRPQASHRHVTCAMPDLAFLTVQRTQHGEQQAVSENDTVSNRAPEQGDGRGKATPAGEVSAYRRSA